MPHFIFLQKKKKPKGPCPSDDSKHGKRGNFKYEINSRSQIGPVPSVYWLWTCCYTDGETWEA